MSKSTEAVFFYGIPFDEDDDYYDELISREYPDPNDNHSTVNIFEYLLETSEELEDSGECYIGHHCSLEYNMYYLAVKDTYAPRGYTKAVNDLIDDVNKNKQKHDLMLKTFCEKFNLPFSEPNFYICSYTG